MAASGPDVQPADRRGGRVGGNFPDVVGEDRKRAQSGGRLAFIGAVTDLPVSAERRRVVGGIGAADPILRDLHFLVRRSTAEQLLIDPVDPRAIVGQPFKCRIANEPRGLPQDQRAVEEIEGLLRHRGLDPLCAVVIGMRQVKGHESPGQRIPIDKGIDAAPHVGARFFQAHRPATGAAGIEHAAGRQHPVAHRFEVEPAAVPLPEHRVGLIDRIVLRRALGREAKGL